MENAISSSAYTKLNDLKNSINCFGFLNRSGDGERIIRKNIFSLETSDVPVLQEIPYALYFTHVPLPSLYFCFAKTTLSAEYSAIRLA